MLRNPKDIIHKGVRLSDAMDAHELWLAGAADGERLNWSGASLDGASLSHASLSHASLDRASLDRASLNGASLNYAWLDGASLNGASLNGASLNGAYGNMLEVKSAQFDRWAITWTRDAAGTTTLQIGCQKNDLELWRQSDPRWIRAMDSHATEWWAIYRDLVLAMVDASPARRHAGGSK